MVHSPALLSCLLCDAPHFLAPLQLRGLLQYIHVSLRQSPTRVAPRVWVAIVCVMQLNSQTVVSCTTQQAHDRTEGSAIPSAFCLQTAVVMIMTICVEMVKRIVQAGSGNRKA